jgi:glycopeptide antibiotics resistance protein
VISGVGILAGLVGACLVGLLGWRSHRPWLVLIAQVVAVAHVGVVIELGLFPLPVQAEVISWGTPDFAAYGWAHAFNLVPFATIGPQLQGIGQSFLSRQLAGNVGLLVPMAWYAPVLWPRLRRARWFVAVAVGVAATIELAQLGVSLVLGVPYRSIDIDDVILNAGGAIAAFLMLRLVAQGLREARRPRAAADKRG